MCFGIFVLIRVSILSIYQFSSLLWVVASSLFTRLSRSILLNETVFNSHDLILKVLSVIDF